MYKRHSTKYIVDVNCLFFSVFSYSQELDNMCLPLVLHHCMFNYIVKYHLTDNTSDKKHAYIFMFATW